MKKFFESFYIFSKFTISLVLLICLISLLYVFYVNYEKESISTQNEINIETDLNESINKNSTLITKLSDSINLNKSSLEQIKNSIESIALQDQSDEILSLNKNIELINENLTKLSEEIKNLKSKEVTPFVQKNDEENFISRQKNDIIELILIKYENNINYNTELDYLTSIIDHNKKIIIDKLSILSMKPYKGHHYLKTVFDNEVNLYLKNIINKNSVSLFSKIVLPYIQISPTSENSVNSDSIIKIKKIQFNIEKNSIDNAFKYLKTIDNYEKYFEITKIEIVKYLDFKNELLKLK